MQIVIDIPEWKYKSICEEIEASKRCGVVGIDHNVHEAIANGTPLPKGHGRLIDADAMSNRLYTSEASDFFGVVTCAEIADFIDDEKPIIEADKESEDNK